MCPSADDAGASDGTRALSNAEAALYDRQIRLWGVEAQQRLAASHVLITSPENCQLLQEVAKNVVLSGIASLKLHVSSSEQRPGFLGSDVNALMTALREINPLVNVEQCEMSCDVGVIRSHEPSIVCSIGQTKEYDCQLNQICRKLRVPFYCGRDVGPAGYFFADLGAEYRYTVKQSENPQATTNKTTNTVGTTVANVSEQPSPEVIERYVEYADAIASPWGGEPKRGECAWHAASCISTFEISKGRLPGSDPVNDVAAMVAIYDDLCESKSPSQKNYSLIKYLAESGCHTLPPVCAVLGGMWGREIVKVISRKDAPLNNFFFFNARSSQGFVETVGKSA